MPLDTTVGYIWCLEKAAAKVILANFASERAHQGVYEGQILYYFLSKVHTPDFSIRIRICNP